VAPDQCFAFAAVNDAVTAVLRLDLEGGAVRQVIEVYTALDFRLHYIPIHLIAHIRMRSEKSWNRDLRSSVHAT
jgi:hypothetical protein